MLKKIVPGVVALIIAGAGYYFTSDVGRARMDSAHDQYARWTPENIAKEPLLYLDFCEREAREGLEKLKANRIAVAQNLSKLTAQKSGVDSKLRVGDEALAELRGLFAGADTKWPVTWRDHPYDEATFKKQVVQFKREGDLNRKLSAQYATALRSLEALPAKIVEASATLEGQIAEIRVQREILKIQKMSDTLAAQFAGIKTALQDTSAIIADSASPVILTTEDLARQSADAGPSDDEFRMAMGM